MASGDDPYIPDATQSPSTSPELERTATGMSLMTAKLHILSPSPFFALSLALVAFSAAAQQTDATPPPAVTVVEIKSRTVPLTYQWLGRQPPIIPCEE